MKIGISLGMLRPQLWLAVTEEADRLGFESVWLPDHVVFPRAGEGSPYADADHPPVPADVPVFDVFAYLGFLAARTSRIRLGTLVYNLGLRHPFVAARGVGTVDMLSQGRVEFGVGASWLRAEWEAMGLDFATRGRRVDEALEVCRRLWRDDTVEFHGEFFDFEPVAFAPKPVQAPWPPLHIGGDGTAARRRAATVGDGWVPMNHTLEDAVAAARVISRHRDELGRTRPLELTLVGGEGTDDLRRRADAGVGRAIVRPWRSSRGALDGLRRFADEVLPAVRDHPVADLEPR